MKQVLRNQGEMKATLESLKKQLGNKTFDFAKSSHVVNVCHFLQKTCNTFISKVYSFKLIFIHLHPLNLLDLCITSQEKVTKIFAKAYIQLGRFIKPNASKTVSPAIYFFMDISYFHKFSKDIS